MAYAPFVEVSALDAFKATLPFLLILAYIISLSSFQKCCSGKRKTKQNKQR